MPSKAAETAFAKLREEKAQELSSGKLQELLSRAEKRVTGIVERGHIFDENAERELNRFDRTGEV